MALPGFDPDQLHHAFAGTVFGLGEGADVDEAFDEAAGSSRNPVTFASADPSALEVITTGLSLDQAVGSALTWLAANPDSNAVAAFGIVGRAAHSRKKRRFRLDGPHLEPDTSAAGRWSAPDGDLAAALTSAEGWDVAPGEMFETVEYARRARYRPVVEVIRTKSAGQFAAFDGDVVVTRGHRTAGEARREAVRLLKERGKDDHELTALEVWKLGGREDGQPLIRVNRTRVAQTVTVKLVHAALKSDKPAKVVGWLYVTGEH